MSALSPQQFVTHMPVAELSQYADPSHLTDPASKRNVNQLATSMEKVGYQTRKHNGMSGDTRSSTPSSPITLVHSDLGTSLAEGNHRVHAAGIAGLKKLPVLVKDFRT